MASARRSPLFRIRWPRLIAIALTLLIPLLTLVFLAGTESGRLALTRGGIAIAGYYVPDLQFETEGLASREFGHWYFSRLRVRYGERTMVEGREVTLQVDLHRLWRNQVHVAQATASSLLFDNTVLGDYLIAHVEPEEVVEAAEELDELNMPAIWIEQLAIERLTLIDRQLEGFPVLKVEGHGTYQWPGQESALHLSINEHGGSALAVRLRGAMAAADRYLLEFSASERAGGFVTGKLQLPEGQDLDAEGRVMLDIQDDTHVTATVEQFSLPLVNHRFGLLGRAAITLSPWSVETEGLTLTVDDTQHQVAGRVDDEAMALDVRLNKLPLAISQPWQDYLQGGWLSADLNVRGPLALPEVNGTLELKSTYQKQPLHLTGDVESREKVIHIKSARVRLAGAGVDAKGTVDVANETTDLEGLIEQLPLKKIREILTALEETREIEIPPEVDGNIDRLTVSASGNWNNPQLAITLDGSVNYQDLSTEVHGAASGDLKQFAISDILVEGEGVRVSGSGAIGIEAETLQFQLDVAARDLQPAEQLGLPLDPGTRVNMDAVVAVKGPWDNPQMSAQITSQGRYRAYRYRLGGGVAGNAQKLTLDRLRLDLFEDDSGADIASRDQSLVPADPTPPDADYPLQEQSGAGIGTLAEEAEEAASSGNAWLEINGVVEPKAQRANGSIAGRNIPVTLAELAGVALPPSLTGEISIDGQFSGPFSAPEVAVNILGLGRFRGEPWQVQGDVGYVSGSVQLADVRVLWAGRNQLTANGNLSAETLELDLRAQATLADFEDWINADISDSGELSLWATAQGSPKAPVLAGELKITGRAPTMRDDALVQAPLNLLLEWQTENGDLNAKLDASHGSRRAAEATLTLAIAPILEQLFAEPATGEAPSLPVDLDAQGQADLQALSAFFDPEIHSMRGMLTFDMTADGNTRAPNMHGRINLRDGYYEHRPTNTRLRNLVFVAELTPEQWRIVEAGARDRKRGRVDLTGAMTFRPPEAPALDFALRAKEAHLLNMPGARGAFTGELRLTGSTEDALLAGTLNLRPLAVQVEHFLGSSVPEIDVIEVEVDASRDQEGPSALQNIALALEIVLEEQSYVRGLGLDSELKGRVEIGGTAANPQPSGSLTIVRGKFDLLGKKFELQEGQVQFENMVAAIYVRGVHTYPEGEITAVISGTTDDLKVEFSSNPAAAQDEIFAQLLFGKSLTDISPLQAVRLVTVVRTLQSGGTGFDPVAKTRDLIGLDTLDVETEETDEGDQYALSLGKYITSRIYLELQRSTDPLNPWQAEMQIELRKNLRLEIKSSDGNETSAGSIELQWKKDY